MPALVVRWLMQPVVLLGLLTAPAAGCSAERDDSTADPTTSAMATAGPVTFVAEARAMTFGTKDLAAASDGELLRLGKVVCEGLGIEGPGFGRVVQRLMQSEAHATTTEARAFVRSAVRNLCPEHVRATR